MTDRHCLDAETVAAWMDGGLDVTAAAAAEAHASTCERCQALLATVVKTLPADQQEQSQVVSGFSRIDKRPTNLWRWWLAPIAATAAAVTIWMIVPQTPVQRPPSPESARDVAAAPAAPVAQAPSRAPLDQSTAPPAPPSVADAKRNLPAAANEAKAKLAGADANKPDATATGRKDQPASAEASARKQEKREELSARAAEGVAVTAAPPAAAAPATEVTAERMREAPAAPNIGAVTQLRKQVAGLEWVSPNPLSRWRSATRGSIERSEDGGRTWLPVRIFASEEALAGASPSPLVCWVVGRNGLVLLATDGTNFTRLPFPESVDLVSVTSSRAGSAVVTTADGRTFVTENTGKTWRNP